VLRDGSHLELQRALPEDARRLETFLVGLEPEERQQVSASLELEPDEMAGFLKRLAERATGEVFFTEDGGPSGRVSSFAAYRVMDDERVAAITLAVKPELRQQGAGTLLLQRLAVLAARRDVRILRGVAHADNRALAELFRQGGFAAEETRQGDLVTYELSTDDPELARAPEGLGARIFTATSLQPLFHPRSVAVVGASRDPDSVGYRILDALVSNRFAGPVYPINPNARHVASIRAYPSVTEVGEEIDLAVIAVPASLVAEVVEECADVGVRGLIVISAGFAETGEEGRRRQQDLCDRIRDHGMRMIGPNCLGLIHTDPEIRLDASFAPRMPPRGTVALCSQSGALGIAIIALAERLGLGLSSFVSVGNKADVSSNDLLEYWEEDPDTHVVLLYLESFGNPRRFARIARRVSRSTPVVAVKSGRTEAGGRAASSHTAALTAADTTVSALFRQTGVIRADSLQEMFGVARAFTSQPLPPGRRVAVVTNAGGPGILCVDAAQGAGMEVEALSEETQRRLGGMLPEEASTRNPVDMIASAGPETYRKVVEAVLCAEEVDALVVIYTPVGMFDTDEVGRAVASAVAAARSSGGVGKPVLASIVGGEEERFVLGAEDEGDERIPVYQFPEEMGRLLGQIADYAEWRRADPGVFPEFDDTDIDRARDTCRKALEERGEGWLSVEESRRVLDAAGLRVAAGGVARDADEAVAIAEDVGYPVAVKLASLEIAHKTEIGGVVLDLADGDAVRQAYSDIRDRLEEEDRLEAMEGVLVQPMLEDATEVMVGVDQDPLFGPVIAFGLGGIHVEIIRDVAFRTTPMTDRDARQMVREIKGFRLLEGYRGHPPADVEALEEGLLRLSRLVDGVPEIAEIDLNPIFAFPPGDGYRIADARIRVEAVEGG
jgi:acetyl coenzyme A synthetase (ADP forming)-like protein